MSKVAFIFPGQGAQVCGMGQEFYENSETAKQIFDKAGEWLGFSMTELCFTPNDRLDITEYTQPAMVTAEVAMMRVLEENGVHADMAAGLSLGEYSALVAAGVMNEEDAIRTVRERGILMQEAVPAGEGAMAAVLALDAAKIEEVTESMEGVWIANYNCPGQIVISGETEAVKEAAERLKEAGAKRCVMLNVSGPFHSGMLVEAGRKLREVLDEVSISKPVIPYIANVNAELITEESQIKDLLCRQVSSSVRWEQSVRKMLDEGVDVFVEIGPGKTLSSFVKKIKRDALVVNVEHVADIAKVKEALGIA